MQNKKSIAKVRRYEAKNPDYARYMRMLSGARGFINPTPGTKGYERVSKTDRYQDDLKDLKKLLDEKLGSD